MKLVSISSNAKAYHDTLVSYAEETGKEISEALAREGPDFRQELFNQFREIHPKEKSIADAAKARGFKVKRNQSSFLVKTENGVSARALNRAKELLGGQKTEYFRLIGDRLAPARFSAQKGNRLLRGGRTGWRFSGSALRGYQLSPEQLRASLSAQTSNGGTVGQDVRRLNLRALAVYLELRYRQRAAQGGTMAVQWLFKTWRRGNSKQRAQLVQRSATNIPIGTVDFEQDLLGNLQTIVFDGYVPGTGEQAEKHGVLGAVFSARASKLQNAIQLHHAKVARQHGLN